MTCSNYDICMIAGDSFELNIIYRDSDKNPIDLTGYTLYFQARKNQAEEEFNYDKTIVITDEDGEQGLVRFVLLPSETELLGMDEPKSKYVYAMKLTSLDETDVKTILSGTLEVIQGVI